MRRLRFRYRPACVVGGDDRFRPDCLLHAMQMLSSLSYVPVVGGLDRFRPGGLVVANDALS